MNDKPDIVITNYIGITNTTGYIFTTEEDNSYSTHSNASYSISK